MLSQPQSQLPFQSQLQSASKPNNPKILSDHIITLSQTRSKQQILGELNRVDQQLYQLYEGSNGSRVSFGHKFASSGTAQGNSTFVGDAGVNTNMSGFLASSFYNTTSSALGIPKNNSLTDSFLRSTLGCEDKLAKSYMQIIDQQDLTEQIQREKRIQQAKKRFGEANSYKDFYANCKPFMDKTILKTYLKKTQPVVDNQHEAYLKTQLIYLEKPLIGVKKISEKEYYDKHADVVAKKINQIGGMEDTVGNMEQSLARNQLKNFSKRSQFVNNSPNPFRKDNKSLTKKQSGRESNNSWVDRSKSIREALMTKFDIQ